MTTMTNLDVRQYLPHRYPFLMIDRVLSVEPGKSIVALKNVTTNEPFFTGHLPNMPVMPGVMIVETLAQASGILIYKSMGEKSTPEEFFYLAGINEARFKQMVTPGDQLQLNVEVMKKRLNLWKFKGEASVDGEIVCTAEFMCIKAPAIEAVN